MTIREYTIDDLRECLRTDALWRGDVIPITKHRALSHIHNPRAESTDVALLVAYDGEKTVGYLGILPDKIFAGDQVHRIGWLTAWWADPDRKYAGVGLMLLAKAMKLYAGQLAASAFSEKARVVFTASKQFVPLRDVPGLTVLVRFNSRQLLPQKWPKLEPLAWLFGVADAVANVCFDLRWRRWLSLDLPVETIGEIDGETQRFIAEHRRTELTRRDAAELNWLTKYPWVLNENVADATAARFHFSSVAHSFAFHNLKVRDASGRLIGFLVLNIRDGHLRTPYCCFEPDHAAAMLRVVGHYIAKFNVSRLTTFQTELVSHFASAHFPCVYQRQTMRPWIIGSMLKDLPLDQLGLQDGDGDCAFT